MRIGIVTACYKPVINGVTRMVSLYKDYLIAQGHDVLVFTLGDPDPAGDEPNIIRSPGLPVGDTGYYVSIRYTSQAQKLLREMDIVHCHHLVMSVEMAHRYCECPIVYTNHTRYDLYSGTYFSVPQPAADAIMRQMWPEFTDYCDVVIAPSAGVRDVMDKFGVRRPIEVIPNGIDLTPFWQPTQPRTKADLNVPEDATLFVYVGRLANEKNLNGLIEQFAYARQVVPNIHLAIVGKGPQEDELREEINANKLASCIHLIGAVPYEDVSNVLAAADVFITASISEVHPLTVIEAMAAGLPTIAIESPGISDTVIPGRTGILTQSYHALSAAIVGMVSVPGRVQEMSQSAKQASQQYDIQQTIQQTIDLYHRLSQERPDLRRKDPHGRWRPLRDRQPLIEQLTRLVRLPS